MGTGAIHAEGPSLSEFNEELGLGMRTSGQRPLRRGASDAPHGRGSVVKNGCKAMLVRLMFTLTAWSCLAPKASALPSFARQTGQKCAACHVGGNWPQLTAWGRFFKLSGYTAGASIKDKEGVWHLPVGLFGQAGITFASQPNDAAGNLVVDHNASPELYALAGELGTKVTNFMGIFYTYSLNNNFPGWSGVTGPADVRAGTSMPALQLNDDQLNALAAILLRLNPANASALEGAPDYAVAGALVYQANQCDACHMINGAGNAVGPPSMDFRAATPELGSSSTLRIQQSSPQAALCRPTSSQQEMVRT